MDVNYRKIQNLFLHSGAKLEENCVEAQKKELAENLEQEDCQANEGDEEETVLLGAEIRGSYSEPEEEEHKYCPYCGCKIE